MREKNIIIVADDFGLNVKANARILELAKLGKLDRVAVMAFGTYKQEEIAELLATGVSLDIHLHLERMKSDAFQNRGLHQSLPRRGINFLRMLFGAGKIEEVEKEWQTEIDEFCRIFQKNPDGLNSHEHIHYFPPYFKLALKFQKKFSFSYFRFGRKGLLGKTLAANILKFLWSRDKTILLKSDIVLPTSDYLISFDWLRNPTEYFQNFSSPEKVEILFHPEKDREFEFLKKM